MAILALWIVMMGLLVQREREARRPVDAPPVEWRQPTETVGAAGPAREQWMGVYLNGTKLGYTVTRRQKQDGILRIEAKSHLLLPLQGEMRAVETESLVEVDAAQYMRSFSFTLDSEMQQMRVTGHVEPDRLVLRIESGGTTATRTIPLEKPITVPDALTPILAGSGRLRANTTHTLDLFDPMALAPAKAMVTIGQPEMIEGVDGPIRVLRAEISYKGFRTTAWVTPEGDTLKEESAMGWTMVRQNREDAMKPPEGDPQTDLVYSAAVPTNRVLKSPRQVKFLRAELTGADFSTLSLATERQQVEAAESGIVEIRREVPEAVRAPRLPVTNPQMKPYLAPDLLIQSDDPAIIETARKIVGRESDSWKAAVRIARWVHREVEKSPTVSVPSALEVLRTRKGDCNEHTVLFVALARAAGIPAEIAVGIVYLNDSFFYHAWPRVWVGQWVSMDPTFGQEVADATHIELVHGGLDRQSEIVRLIGRLRVRIIRAEE